MTSIGPFNHQAIFESDTWNVFHSLGLGYNAYLFHPSNGPTIWCIPPKDTEYADFYKDEDVIQELIDKGLVVQRDDNLIDLSTARFELTEKGRGLYTKLSSLMFAEGQHQFISKIQPTLK